LNRNRQPRIGARVYRFSLLTIFTGIVGLCVSPSISHAQLTPPNGTTKPGNLEEDSHASLVAPEGSGIILLVGGLLPIAGVIVYRRMRHAKTTD
jgi:hypothetical protein